MPKRYSVSEYLLLTSKLSQRELNCLSHCLVFDDCATNSNCKLQDKVDNILKEMS